MPICPHCGFEADPGARACPLCGSAPLRPAAEAEAAGPGPAWGDPGRPFGARLVRTWRESLFEPTAFFRRVRRDSSLSDPLLYFLLVTVVGAFFSLWWDAVGVAPGGWDGVPALGLGTEVGGAGVAVVGFFISPFAALIGLALWTLMLHLFVVVLVPERRPLGSTARLLCYSAGPGVLAAVPILGSLVGAVWMTVLQIVGVREVHGATTGRAAAAVLAPLGILLLLGILLFALLVTGAALLESYA